MSQRYEALCKMSEHKGLIVEIHIDMKVLHKVRATDGHGTVEFRKPERLVVRSKGSEAPESKVLYTQPLHEWDDLDQAATAILRRVV